MMNDTRTIWILLFLLTISGSSEVNPKSLGDLQNKLKSLQKVVTHFKTTLENKEKELDDPLSQILESEDEARTPAAGTNEDLLRELKNKVQYLESMLDKEGQRATVTRSENQRATVTRGEDQRATVTRGEDLRATVTRGEDQRATVTRGEDQRATVTRGEDQRATVTRKKDQRATVTRGEDQRATVTRDEDQRATVTRGENQRATVTRGENQRATVTKQQEERATVTRDINPSPAEVDVLKKIQSKILQLRTILQNSEDQREDKVIKPENPPSSPDEAELLQTIQRKIREFQRLHNDAKTSDNSQNLKISGVFEEFEPPEEKWEDEPLPESQLGLKTGLSEFVNTAEKPSENVINEVKRRLLSDIRFARENGVDITQLMRSLKTKQVRSVKSDELEVDLEELSPKKKL